MPAGDRSTAVPAGLSSAKFAFVVASVKLTFSENTTSTDELTLSALLDTTVGGASSSTTPEATFEVPSTAIAFPAMSLRFTTVTLKVFPAVTLTLLLIVTV